MYVGGFVRGGVGERLLANGLPLRNGPAISRDLEIEIGNRSLEVIDG